MFHALAVLFGWSLPRKRTLNPNTFRAQPWDVA